HLGDHAFTVVDLRRKADHLEHDLVVGLSVLDARVAYGDGASEHGAVNLHEGRAGRFEVRAYEAVSLALEDLDNGRARVAKLAARSAAVFFEQADQNHVAGRGVGG